MTTAPATTSDFASRLKKAACPPTKSISATVPAPLADELAAACAEHGVSRSLFVTEALKAALASLDGVPSLTADPQPVEAVVETSASPKASETSASNIDNESEAATPDEAAAPDEDDAPAQSAEDEKAVAMAQMEKLGIDIAALLGDADDD